MFVAHTSSNCLSRVSVSPLPTVYGRVAAPSSLTAQAPSIRFRSLGRRRCHESGPVLGAVDGTTTLLYAYAIGTLHFHAIGPYSYTIVIFAIPGQHIVRLPKTSKTYIPIQVYWVDRLFLFSGLIRRTWYLTSPPPRNKTMTLDPPSSQCSNLLNFGHFHARRDAVSSFFLTLLRSDTPRIGSFSFMGTIGTCWKSFTP